MRLTRRNAALIGLCLLFLAASCSEASGNGDDAALYTAVIRRVAAGESNELPDNLFVETLPGTKISLADQTSIVKALDDSTDVRFIDDREEAIDDAEPDSPVRHAGVLVRVGSAERAGGTAQVEAERYVAVGDEQSLCVEVHQTDDEWEAVSAQEC